MAPRPSWKGYLKLSLVACAVELTGATTQTEKVRFKVINRETGNTVRRQYVDAATGRPVAPENEVKGYEVGKDEYLLVEEGELDALQIESSHTLNIESFVDKSAIEQVYLDTPYYVTPADDVSSEAFAVIREAMAQKGKAGLARIVLYRRERPAVIEPLGNGLLLTTLRYAMMVRRPEDVMGDIGMPKLDREMVALAGHIIDQKQGTFDPATFEDHYERAILDLIRAKQAGKAPPTVRPAGRPSNVVNLFEALRQSLAEEVPKSGGASGRKPSGRRNDADEKGGRSPTAPTGRKATGRAAPRAPETPRRPPSRRRSA